MARCGCQSTALCVVEDGTCIAHSGDCSAADPLRFDLLLDPRASNAAECGANGLYVAAGATGAIVTADSSTVQLTGSGAAGDPLTAAEWAPLFSRQAAEPPYTGPDTWHDFTAAQWPRISITGPQTGTMGITINAMIQSVASNTSTVWLSFRTEPDLGIAIGAGDVGLVAAGGRVGASRTTIVAGWEPGTDYTLIPTWMVTSLGTGEEVFIRNGVIYAEPVTAPAGFTAPAAFPERS